MSAPHPTPDPTGDLRATLLARLEYQLDPVTDERYDAVYGRRAQQAVDQITRTAPREAKP